RGAAGERRTMEARHLGARDPSANGAAGQLAPSHHLVRRTFRRRSRPSGGSAFRCRAMSVHVESVGVGRSLVLLHGWGMHSGLWFPLLPRLSNRYRMHLVDLPGHGYSEALITPPPLSLAR